MYCFKCGCQLPDGARFCSSCGQAQPGSQNSGQADNNIYGDIFDQFFQNPGTADQNKKPAVIKRMKLPSKKIVILIAVAVAALIVISIIASSSGGAKYQITMDGGVSFKIFDDIENGTYNGKLIEFYAPEDYAYLCDEQGRDIGRIEWDSEIYDSAEAAEKDLTDYMLLGKGFGYEIETTKSHGITIKTMYDPDDGEAAAMFCVGNYLYGIEFDDVDRSTVKKIIGSVKK